MNKESKNLFQAIKEGDVKSFKKALENGADLEAKNEIDGTPLLQAIIEKRYEMGAYLVRKGADLSFDVMSTAYMLMGENAMFVQFLNVARTAIAKPKTEDSEKNEADLLIAISEGDVDKVKDAIKLEVNPNCQDSQGVSALRWAIGWNKVNAEIVKTLLDAGADPNEVSDTGWTAMTNALLENNDEVVKILLDHGAKKEKRIEFPYEKHIRHALSCDPEELIANL